MARAVLGLVALLTAGPALADQADRTTQTFVIQGPDGTVGVGAVQSTVQPVPGTVFVPGQGQAPARDNPQPPKTGTSRIRGRVVAADTGLPIRRAAIRLSSPELRDGRSTATDAEGRYEFRELPAGRYTLTASKSAYVTSSYGAREPRQLGRVLELVDRQEADRVDFTLTRGGVITGRVIDEFGDPVPGAMVQPLRSDFLNGQRRQIPGGPMATTSDTGEFRLWGLLPSDYQVMVTFQRMMGPVEASDDRAGYATTYYPGTANPEEAKSIPVAAGQTASGLDIMLTPTRTATVSGVAVDASGQALRRGNVMLMPKTSNGVFIGPSGGGPVRPDGTFSISNVAPGEYTARATIPPSAPGMAPEQLTATVSVAGADVSGVVLTPVRPIKVAGRITLDPPGTWVGPAAIRIVAQPKNPEPMPFAGSGPPITKDDFTFELTSGASAVLLRAFPAAPGGTSWTLKSVQYDGRDIIDTGLDLSDGHDIADVEVVLTNRQQLVTGLVTSAKGEPAVDATVMFFPQDSEEWTSPTRHIGNARPDQNGRYSMRMLPPGDYLVVALESPNMNRRVADPRQFYEELSRGAVRMTLREGDTRTLDLKVTPQQ